jgi:hypothetical protein
MLDEKNMSVLKGLKPASGPTLRQMYAAMAMQGMLTSPDIDDDPQAVAEAAFRYADAMLDEGGR